ncbi:MAG: rod-binding protein [Planctomycetaceae bacterium]|nr:rod-binding protein [Planctomycetaceae bacterium]
MNPIAAAPSTELSTRLAGTSSNRVISDAELESTFQKMVGGLFFSQLMKSLRSTTGEPAYIHGGQAEKLFESQLDQVLIEDLAETKGSAFVGDLYAQFRLQLRLPPKPTGNSPRPPTFGTATGNLTEESRSAVPSAAAAIADASPANSPQPSLAAQSVEPVQPLDVLKLVRQARSVSERLPATTPTTVLSGLFRK